MTKKHTIYIFVLLVTASLSSCSSNDNILTVEESDFLAIPDARFEEKLISLGIDSDGEINQQLLKTDAEKVQYLDIESSGITDLSGIEGFKNLKTLFAYRNELSSIDLSFNTLLDTLDLVGNSISILDVSNNPLLSYIDIEANGLSSITGLSEVTHLKILRMSFNDLTEFIIANESIETLYISDNFLESFDATGSKNLKNIFLKSNNIKEIDLSANTQLKTLTLSGNKLSTINLDENINLSHLQISSNSLTHLDVSKLKRLIWLTVHQNPSLSCIKILDDQHIPTVTKSEYQELNNVCS